MYGTRRIPSDVIRDIFSHLSSPLKVHEAHKFPWYLGQICSQWRAAFLLMQPYFWSEVEIEKPQAHNGGKKRLHVARTMEILTFFLDMTRGAPFSFTLFALQLEPLIKKNVPYVQTVLSKFLNYSAQWKNVVMEVQLSQLALLRDIKNQLPMLQTLTLMMLDRVPSDYEKDNLSGDDADSVLRRELCDLFEDAPQLTRIQLNSICSAAWRFNWASLTSIHLSSTDGTKEIISTLRQTVNLERFSVDEIFYLSYLNPADFEIVKLPCLKYLSVYGVLLLTVLEAPGLKELRITFHGECATEDEPDEKLDDSEVAGRINAFLVRSKCVLSKFSALSLDSPVLNDIFPHMPDVQELYIQARYMPYISEVFECLGGSESSTQTVQPTEFPLSHLSVLSIFSFFEDEDLKPVNEMMARRNPMAGNIDAGPKELILNLNGMARHVTTELESLESMCEDRGIRFAFDCWGPGMFFVIG
ncbi:hypothetical protein F5887DRAFT_1286904 [Amanita rubescens]|nr:hypothetical protein F5887DRAFT_1286904 [Amanita rubescens]